MPPTKLRTIKGKQCKEAILDLGTKFTQTGKLQLEGVQKMWGSACDGGKVTVAEKNSIDHIVKTKGATKEVEDFLEFWLNETEAIKMKGGKVITIDKVRCDKPMIDVADLFVQRGRGSPVGIRGAEAIWFSAMDGKGVTKTEKDTLELILRKYKFDESAAAFLGHKVEWLGIAQNAIEVPAPGERVAARPDDTILAVADLISMPDQPAPTPSAPALNPLAMAPVSKGSPTALAPSSPAEGKKRKDLKGSGAVNPAKSGNIENQLAVFGEPQTWSEKLWSWIMPSWSKKRSTPVSENNQHEQPPTKRRRIHSPSIKLQELRDIFDECDRKKVGLVGKIDLIKACAANPKIAEFFELPTHIRQEDGTRTKFEDKWREIDSDSSREISWPELLAYYKDKVVDI